MYIHLDHGSSKPISHQVIEQIKWMVVSEHLKPGEKLPSIRKLSQELKINPTTVSRIYHDLSQEGIIVLRQGQGAFISTKTPIVNKKQARKEIESLAKKLLVESLQNGFSKKEIDQILNKEYQKIKTEKNK